MRPSERRPRARRRLSHADVREPHQADRRAPEAGGDRCHGGGTFQEGCA